MELVIMKISRAEYKIFFKEIKERIVQARYQALKAVNKELIGLYWDIGRHIVDKQEKLGWGKAVVENLAKDLQKEFPGIQGFSVANLWRMKNFYIQYYKNEKLAPLVREISWAKNVVIMEKCKNDMQREFYILITKKYGLTKNVLIHRIENESYEKYLLNQTSFDKTLPAKYKGQAKLAVKDEYTFDFLEMGEEYSERELEIALVNNIRRFLIEMGSYFTFIGNQYRVEINDNEYFIDLLLYHRKLKCLIAIEIKVGSFKPEYAGKMQFYLSALDDKVRLKEENPSIGIIICRDKDRTIVEYSLKDVHKPMGVATYILRDKLPKKYKNLLPSPAEIAKRLEVFGKK